MMNKDFAFASHLHDVHSLVAANVTGLRGGWYSVVVVVVVGLVVVVVVVVIIIVVVES